MHRATAASAARDDDSELAGRREVGSAEHRRRDERLARRAVLALELAHRRDAVGAHHEMDRAGGEPARQAAGTVRDLSDDRVLDEHRDHDLAASRELGNGLATRAPAASNGAVCAATTSNTQSSCPASSSRRAMPPPIRPSPMKPTRIAVPRP